LSHRSHSKAALLQAVRVFFVVLALAGARAGSAQETCPCPPPPPPPPLWTGSLGLSYLATSGNTDTESLGFAVAWARQPTPWGLEISALANRAESDGETTAERYFAGLRGKRTLGESFELFGGFSYESNEFAGFDSRALVEAGGIWKVLTGPVHELAFDAGLTWTQESPVVGEEFDYLGAVAGAAYVWKISDVATLRERLLYFPNFDTSDDWRWSSETALEAAIAASWALRVGYLYTSDNLPAPGFEKADSTTTVSVVFKR
jgi:putative salt-induced outer membrane protein